VKKPRSSKVPAPVGYLRPQDIDLPVRLTVANFLGKEDAPTSAPMVKNVQTALRARTVIQQPQRLPAKQLTSDALVACLRIERVPEMADAPLHLRWRKEGVPQGCGLRDLINGPSPDCYCFLSPGWAGSGPGELPRS
jgi:hypothetical protein